MDSLALAALALLTAASASADTLRYPTPWAVVGGGFAQRRVYVDYRPEEHAFDGRAIYLSLGVHVSRSLSAGIDALHTARERNRSTFVLATAGYHPWGRSGPFVRAGLGAGRSSGVYSIIDDIARLRVTGTVAALDHVEGNNRIRPAYSAMIGWAIALPVLEAHVAAFAAFTEAPLGPHPVRVSMIGAGLVMH